MESYSIFYMMLNFYFILYFNLVNCTILLTRSLLLPCLLPCHLLLLLLNTAYAVLRLDIGCVLILLNPPSTTSTLLDAFTLFCDRIFFVDNIEASPALCELVSVITHI